MKAEIIDIIDETPKVKTFKLKLEKQIEYQPGQFIMVIFNSEEKPIKRAYSISSYPSQPTNEITITLNEVPNGNASCKMFSKKQGDSLELEGPYGNFKLNSSNNPKVFIAAGTGITPLMAMMESIKEKPIKKTLLYSTKTKEDIIFRDKLTHEGLNCVHTLTQEEWEGQTGRITKKLIEKHIEEDSEFYISGMRDFVEIIQTMLKELKINKEQIYTERW